MREQPSCPQCGKSFNDEAQVQRHLDQPRAKCHQRPTAFAETEDLVAQFTRQPDNPRTQRLPFERRPRRDAFRSNPEFFPASSTEPMDQDGRVIDFYPGVAKVVHQYGTTFMDAFDQDAFSEIRNTENLYYPFTDRLEWELAEFLVTSDLSMAAIDRFLSLSLVSCACSPFSYPLLLRLDQPTPALLSNRQTATWPSRDSAQSARMEVPTRRHFSPPNKNGCKIVLSRHRGMPASAPSQPHVYRFY